MRILIANRGEIASRIIRTVKRLGMRAIAVYHGEDRNAPFVADADEAHQLHAQVPSNAYLDIEQILGIARTAGVTAVHPGYGFLAENPDFARAVHRADLTFIGPSPEVMQLMGDKIRSRQVAKRAGIPLLPSATITADGKDIERHANKLGFPLLIKAAAGGGGRGMRLVENQHELREHFDSASREATRYFQDGRVYLEQFIEGARHIEVQVFGDGKGGALHLGERDCSIQRNYQKLVEESPAPGLDHRFRESLYEDALRLVRQTKYAGAGTVELILAPDGRHYFLEMNTRLQVEHPVTECITGLDLVELQIEVAKHGSLPITQEQVQFSGHAIEARICAEDPDADFLPSTGRVLCQQAPEGDGIRFDTGVREGQAIGASFDSMLAKLIVHAKDRERAIAKGVKALAQLTLLGLTTNQDYLGRLFRHRAYQAEPGHTNFLSDYSGDLQASRLSATERDQLLIAALLGTRDAQRLAQMTSRFRTRS